jgi:hypothetical protein
MQNVAFEMVFKSYIKYIISLLLIPLQFRLDPSFFPLGFDAYFGTNCLPDSFINLGYSAIILDFVCWNVVYPTYL